MESRERYDAVIVGSGIGALAAGAILAKLKRWRVLILERHFKIGGLTHTFERPGGWKWDVGLHYVGNMGEGMPGRRVMDFITDGTVRWNEMPDPHDVFEYPGITFAVPKGEERYRQSLQALFPGEAEGIAAYFRDLRRAAGWYTRSFLEGMLPAPLWWPLGVVNRWTGRLPLMTTGEYLKRRFRDPRLRALLVSHWGDYGLPPGESSLAVHALVTTHYLDGAWYPEGSAAGIARGAGSLIRAAGGELLPSHEVTRILVDGNTVTGVEVQARKGREGRRLQFHAPVVVSGAGAWTTFARLLPASVRLPFRADLAGAPRGCEMVSLFLGLKEDPGRLGFRGENHWIFRGWDHDEMDARKDELGEGRAAFAYLSFPSLKDGQASRHTAEILAPFPYRALERHRDEPWRRRPPEYTREKEKITAALIGLVEERHPGFRGLVEYAELATPLTFEHFTGAPGGAVYGYPAVPARFQKRWLRVRTPVRGLLLAGADACSLGIVGALMGGVGAASVLLGPLGFFRIMRAAGVDLAKRR